MEQKKRRETYQQMESSVGNKETEIRSDVSKEKCTQRAIARMDVRVDLTEQLGRDEVCAMRMLMRKMNRKPLAS